MIGMLLYMTTTARLAQIPPASIAATKLTGFIAALPGGFPYVLVDQPLLTQWLAPLQACPLPVYVSFTAQNPYADPSSCTLFPWTDDRWETILLPNLRLLGAQPEIAGVLWDSEIYLDTPGGNGGLMDGRAWAGTATEINARALEFQAALRSTNPNLTLGTFAYLKNAQGLPGWTAFHEGFVAPFLMCDEGGYVGSSTYTREISIQRTKQVFRSEATSVFGLRATPAALQSMPTKPTWLYPETEIL